MNKLMDPEEGPVYDSRGGTQSIGPGGCDYTVGDPVPGAPARWWAPASPGHPLPNTGGVGRTTSGANEPAEGSVEPDLIEVLTIWVRDKDDPDGIVWLSNAWDSDTISNSPSKWDETLKKAYSTYGGENVRIVKTTMDYDKIVAAFNPAEAYQCMTAP